MYLLGARWYDPTLNRFVSVDPHPGNQDDPITLNEYAYCRNNPINNTDPDGEFPFNQVALAGVGAGGGTIGIFGSTGAGALLVAAAPYLLAIAAGVALAIAGNNIYRISKKKLKKGEKSLEKTLREHAKELEKTKWEPRKRYYDKEIKSKAKDLGKIKAKLNPPKGGKPWKKK